LESVFDGASSCEGAGVGVLFVAPENEFIVPFSYRLQWDIDYTNNICEYEALVLGLEATKKINIKNLEVYGDAELIAKQVNWQYQAKHPRQRSYRNCAWDLMENLFSSVKVHFILRAENQQADSLAKEASTFTPPTTFKLKYHIEVRHRPSIPNNIKIGRYSKMMNRSEILWKWWMISLKLTLTRKTKMTIPVLCRKGRSLRSSKKKLQIITC
jgi:ribonuclease HI